ncbi:MAG: DUF975 family protein [Clostridia bacterium]|nr:DUF975 family protein [Clostridia bacterium]
MTRSLLKQEAKKQLSKNLGTLILSGLLLGVIVNLPNVLSQFFSLVSYFAGINFSPVPQSWTDLWAKMMASPLIISYLSISLFVGIAVLLFAPVLTLGVHHVYLKATTDEKPHFSEMFSKMSQFGTAFLTSLVTGIFIILWSLLLIVPGIIASYSYSMVYFILAEHPEMSAMDAIRESKRIMKGHRFELFVLQLSFFWWYLLCIVTLGLAMIYVIPYVEMATTNFYNKIKQ